MRRDKNEKLELSCKRPTRPSTRAAARKAAVARGRQLRSGRVVEQKEREDSRDGNDKDEMNEGEGQVNAEPQNDGEDTGGEGDDGPKRSDRAKRTRCGLRVSQKKTATRPVKDNIPDDATNDDAGDINFNGGICLLNTRLRRPQKHAYPERFKPRKTIAQHRPSGVVDYTPPQSTPDTNPNPTFPTTSETLVASRVPDETAKPRCAAAASRSTFRGTTVCHGADTNAMMAVDHTSIRAATPFLNSTHSSISESLVADFVGKISEYLSTQDRPAKEEDHTTARMAVLEADNKRLAIENEQIRNRLEVLETYFYEAVADRTTLGQELLARTKDIQLLAERGERIENDREPR
ncbi:uncharacterized protein BDV17DRAFT_68472 [Aspergillus undulatus]|uniref:uncharacterized protein n=1 Tax=Aspergillus undulatus TaxID=1810928 RepID=UPI003CCD2870